MLPLAFTLDFSQLTQWSAFATIAFLVLTIVAFFLKWGFRFRLVGSTAFMGVVTASIFALGLGLFSRTAIPGAIHYVLVFDNAFDNIVITLPPTATETEVEATLRQAAIDISPFGRLGGEVTVRARTVTHPQPGVSIPLYLGQVTKFSDPNKPLEIKTFANNFK